MKSSKTDAEWRAQLTPTLFKVARKKGTKPAFSGEYHDLHEEGIYCCVCCGTEVFSSAHKFDSGTGWPSYWQPVAEQNVASEEDYSFLMRRTEVHCAACEARLGHVFDDGPHSPRDCATASTPRRSDSRRGRSMHNGKMSG